MIIDVADELVIPLVWSEPKCIFGWQIRNKEVRCRLCAIAMVVYTREQVHLCYTCRWTWFLVELWIALRQRRRGCE